MMNLDNFLEDIESRLDEEREERLLEDWARYAAGEWNGEYFAPGRIPAPPGIEWPVIPINDTLKNPDLMLLHQFGLVSAQLAAGFGGLLTVRSNFGVGILPSLFGAEPFVMPEEMDTLPNVRSLPGGKETILRLVDEGVPDFSRGWGGAGLRLG